MFDVTNTPDTPEAIRARYADRAERIKLAQWFLGTFKRYPAGSNEVYMAVWYFKNVMLTLGNADAPRWSIGLCINMACRMETDSDA